MSGWMRAVVATLLAVSGVTAAAQDVVLTDIYTLGDQGAYWDTKTNLDWARGPTGSTGGYAGFRLASSSEVATFFGDAGLPGLSGTVPGGGPPPTGWLLLYFGWNPGQLHAVADIGWQDFIVADPASAAGLVSYGSMGGAGGVSISWYADPLAGEIAPLFDLGHFDPQHFGIGRALVREHLSVSAVPEPSTAMLMALALLAVAVRGVIRRRARTARGTPLRCCARQDR